MEKTTEHLRKTAAKLLQDQDVKIVIGYGLGSEAVKTKPIFITSSDDVDKLVWNPFCTNNLVKYLFDLKDIDGKIAICVKGCDSLSINRLVQDRVISRDKVIVLGIPCTEQLSYRKLALKMDVSGRLQNVEKKNEDVVIKTNKGEFTVKKTDVIIDKCVACQHQNPVVADHILGEAVHINVETDGLEEIRKLEKMSTTEKSQFWLDQFERCIRCYACRNICSGCACRECIFDSIKPDWAGKEKNVSENELFHLTRAMHLAGRCVDCGECDRVCPMNIPLKLLNQKIIKDCQELFGMSTPAASEEEGFVLGQYHLEDPEEFM